MILYFLPAEKRYVHRLSDVPKGIEPKKVDVPTDLQGLMGFLNELWAAHQIDINLAMQAASDMTRIGIAHAEEMEMEDERVAELPPAMLVTTVNQKQETVNCQVVEDQQAADAVLATGAGVGVDFSTKLDIVALIMETEPRQFGPVLSATLERLGELRKEGIDGLRQFLRGNTALERGVGALFVEAFK